MKGCSKLHVGLRVALMGILPGVLCLAGAFLGREVLSTSADMDLICVIVAAVLAILVYVISSIQRLACLRVIPCC